MKNTFLLCIIMLCSFVNIIAVPQLSTKKVDIRMLPLELREFDELPYLNPTTNTIDLQWIDNDSLVVINHQDFSALEDKDFKYYPAHITFGNLASVAREYYLVTANTIEPVMVDGQHALYERLNSTLKKKYKEQYDYTFLKTEDISHTQYLDTGLFSREAVSNMLARGGSVTINGRRITKQDLEPKQIYDYTKTEYTHVVANAKGTKFNVLLQFNGRYRKGNSREPWSLCEQKHGFAELFPKYSDQSYSYNSKTNDTAYSIWIPSSMLLTINEYRGTGSIQNYNLLGGKKQTYPGNLDKVTGTKDLITGSGNFPPLSLRTYKVKDESYASVYMAHIFPRLDVSPDGRYLLINNSIMDLQPANKKNIIASSMLIKSKYIAYAISPDWKKIAYLELADKSLTHRKETNKYVLHISHIMNK